MQEKLEKKLSNNHTLRSGISMGSDQSQFAQPVNEKELIQDDVEEVIEKSEIPHFDEEQKCKKIGKYLAMFIL